MMKSNSNNSKLMMKNGLSLYQQIISSCSGAVITSIFMTPFDVVKVRLQAQQQALLSRECFIYCNGLMDHICTCTSLSTENWYSRKIPVQLNGTVDAFFKITQSEGVKSLWSGLPPTLIVAIPNTIIYLSTYEQLLKSLEGISGPNSIWAGGIAGGFARGCSVTVVSPCELLRTKVQASTSTSYKVLMSTLSKEIKAVGYRKALWRGWFATVLRDVPFSSLYWFSYENCKRIFNQQYPTVPFALCAGSIAGGVAAVLTLPMDVVKTHQQIEIANGKSKMAKPAIEICQNIFRQQGIAGLYTGLVPRLAKVIPACAVMIATYEYAKRYFRQYNQTLKYDS